MSLVAVDLPWLNNSTRSDGPASHALYFGTDWSLAAGFRHAATATASSATRVWHENHLAFSESATGCKKGPVQGMRFIVVIRLRSEKQSVRYVQESMRVPLHTLPSQVSKAEVLGRDLRATFAEPKSDFVD